MHRKDKFFFEHGLTRLNRWLQNSKNEVITCYPTLQIARTVGSSRGLTAAVVCNTTLLYLFFSSFDPAANCGPIGWQYHCVHGPVGCSDTCWLLFVWEKKKHARAAVADCWAWAAYIIWILKTSCWDYESTVLSQSPSLNKYHHWCACGKFNLICRKYMQYLYFQIYLLKNWIKIFLIILIMYHKY